MDSIAVHSAAHGIRFKARNGGWLTRVDRERELLRYVDHNFRSEVVDYSIQARNSRRLAIATPSRWTSGTWLRACATRWPP